MMGGISKECIKNDAHCQLTRRAASDRPVMFADAFYNSVWEFFRSGERTPVPIARDNELDIISYNAEQTARLGARLGTLLQGGDIICLSGDMGAGKTVFSSGVGKGWESLTALSSPTFNLVHEHRRAKDSQRLYHLDCYRLHTTADAESIGLDDIFGSHGATLIEWPEQIQALVPREHLWVELRVLEATRRTLLFVAHGDRYQTLLHQFRGATLGGKA
jgi:tRNA threonylcarbamoyladenosine biosynthesis protein TsaE